MKLGRNKWAVTLLCAWAVAALVSLRPALAQEQWTSLGSIPDGTWSIAPDPSAATSMYALNSSGLSRTSDKGATWAVCSPAATMMRLVAPVGQTAPLLYATGPSGLRVSADGCKTWKDVAAQGLNPSPAHVQWLASYPNNANVLYAGMDGLGGLYRSIDAGATWQAASKGLPPNSWATSLTADPTSPSVVYVGLRYTGDDHSTAYIYKSTDGGLTWRSSSLGLYILPNNGGYIAGLGWSGSMLFAATSADGIYQSTDRGATWKAATMPRRALQVQSSTGAAPLPLKINSFAVGAEGALLIGTEEGAYQSLDGGQTWQALGPAQTQGKPALVALEATTGRVALAGAGGAWTYKLPAGVVSLPSATNIAGTPPPPTPPPPASLATSTATSTPRPPTPTQTPTVIPTPTVVLVNGPKPTDRVQAADSSISDYFEQTGHNLRYGFRDFWRANGGLGRFGYPLTDEFVENGVSVQYFERARMEFHDGQITLGNLGTELAQGLSGPAFRPIPFFVSEDANIYFGPTKHSVSGPFLDFFRTNGRIESVGYPVSESYKVDEDTEVQWFERARFEWHRSLPEGRRIVLGNIGTEALQRRGWLR